MIPLYTCKTPNRPKIFILMDELAIEHTVHVININNGDQFEPTFLETASNNPTPIFHDRDCRFNLMEKGKIMLDLAI